MFVKLKKKIKRKEIKKLLNQSSAQRIFFALFRKKYKNLEKVNLEKIEILRNFLGKFKNLTVRYKLILIFKKKKEKINVLAKINALTISPQRWFKVAKSLEEKKFKEIPEILGYLPKYNAVFYREIKGESLQDLLVKKKIKFIFKLIPKIAKTLKKFHSLEIKNFFLIKNEKEEKREHRHWLFLIKKCTPKFFKRFKKIYYSFKKFKKKNEKIFLKEKDYILTHNDFHFGNLILTGKKIKIIDFSESDLYDPLNDVASFLSQNESMLRYYFPKNFKKYQKRIEDLFLKSYFKKGLKEEEKKRIGFFKVRNFLQIGAILSFVVWPKKDKFLAVEKSLNLAEKELKKLYELH
jgi:tRNA A-37 threonylcarbamoyl transferase component Bud32